METGVTDNASSCLPPPAPPTPSAQWPVVRVAEPVADGRRTTLGPVRSDPVAIASFVCGLTAFVPVLSQLAGLVLGTWGLMRIRRARAAGVAVGGGWAAIAGIVISGIALIGWAVVVVVLCWAGFTFAEVGGHLPGELPG